MGDATSTSNYDFYNQSMAGLPQNSGQSSVMTIPAREWDANRLASAGINFGIPITSAASNPTGGDVAAMYNEAMRAGTSGSLFAPTPPEWMSAEEYYQFLDMMQGAQQSAAQENRAQGGLNTAAGVYNANMTNPALGQAQAVAMGPNQSADIYDSMRKSYDSQFMPQATNQAYDVAARGAQGGSTGQLTSQGMMGQRAGNIASMYPAALQAGSTLQGQQIQNLLQPAALQQQAGSDYEKTVAQMLGTLFGSGASNYSY